MKNWNLLIRVTRVTLFFALLSLIFFTACSSSNAPAANDDANVQRYKLHGTVVSVDPQAKTAGIEHDAIPGYMAAMTMDFPIRADWVWNDMKPGSEIRADLLVDNKNGKYWLENISLMVASDKGKPAEVNPNVASVGKEVPNFVLTDQDGKKLAFADLKGKAYAVTFIYARCPLPDYCIRMSTNFSDVARKAMADAAERDKIRLISISFDPENDTPEKLRSYGIGYLGNDVKPDFTVWKLVVGKDAEVRKVADFFGLRYEVDETDKTQINHSLRTAVISPEGKITKIFTGNGWTPEELYAALKTAAGE